MSINALEKEVVLSTETGLVLSTETGLPSLFRSTYWICLPHAIYIAPGYTVVTRQVPNHFPVFFLNGMGTKLKYMEKYEFKDSKGSVGICVKTNDDLR